MASVNDGRWVAWYWLLPVLCSAMMVTATLLGLAKEAPDSAPTWCRSPDQSDGKYPDDNLCSGVPRKVIGYYKLACWSVALLFDALNLRYKLGKAYFEGEPLHAHQVVALLEPPFLPCAHLALQCWKLLVAVHELHITLLAREAWNIPSYGLYGWSIAFAGFPNTTKETATHPTLALIAAFSYYFLASRSTGASELWKRVAQTTLMVLSLWYPIYDAKHQCVGSHLSNAGSEYLALYAALVAVIEYFRDSDDVSTERSAAIDAWQKTRLTKSSLLERCLDVQQALLLVLAILRITWLSTRGGPAECWTSPEAYKRLEPKDEFPRKFWAGIVPWGLDLAGTVTLFVIVEAMQAMRR